MYQCGVRKECRERLLLIAGHVSGVMLDVGCAEGYFTRELAPQCLEVYAIDSVQGNIDHCKNEMPQPPNTQWVRVEVEEWVKWDRDVDTTLYMSVHHHLIEQLGMERARTVLFELMLLTDGNLLFDMGQKNEKGCKRYGWWKALPDDEPDDFITCELFCAGARTVEKIGSTPVHGVQRGLWLTSR